MVRFILKKLRIIALGLAVVIVPLYLSLMMFLIALRIEGHKTISWPKKCETVNPKPTDHETNKNRQAINGG